MPANRLSGVVKGCEPLRVCENQPAVRPHAPHDVSAVGINPQSKQSCPARDPPAFPADRDGSEAYCNHDPRSPGLPGANTPSGRSSVPTALVAALAPFRITLTVLPTARPPR